MSDSTYKASCKSYLDSLPSLQGYDGVYWIDTDGAVANAEFQAYCDMSTEGGGWKMIRRVAPASVFNFMTSVLFVTTGLGSDSSSPTAATHYAMADSLFPTYAHVMMYRTSGSSRSVSLSFNKTNFSWGEKTAWISLSEFKVNGTLQASGKYTFNVDGHAYASGACDAYSFRVDAYSDFLFCNVNDPTSGWAIWGGAFARRMSRNGSDWDNSIGVVMFVR